MIRRVALLACLLFAGCGGASHAAPVVKIKSGPVKQKVGLFGIGQVTAPEVGDVLLSSTGTWSKPPTSYSYQWRQCDSAGANCSDVTGATSSSYTVAADDVGHTLRVVVNATWVGGSGSQTSAATGVVSASRPSPVNATAPTVSGVPSMVTADNTFTCSSSCVGSSPSVTGSVSTSDGTWTVNGTSTACNTGGMTCTYQWQDCDDAGANCTSATGAGNASASYTLNAHDLRYTLKATVTATTSGGSTQAAGFTGPGAAQFSRISFCWPCGQALSNAAAANRYQIFFLDSSTASSDVSALSGAASQPVVAVYDDAASSEQSDPGPTPQDECTGWTANLNNATNSPGNASLDWFIRSSTALNNPGTTPSNLIGYGGGAGTTRAEMDWGNTSYQNGCYATVLARYQAKAWNAIIWDNVSIQRYLLGTGQSGYYNRALVYDANNTTAWNTALHNFMTNAQTYMSTHSGPSLMIGNVSDGASTGAPSAANASAFYTDLAGIMGGATVEAFLNGGSGVAQQEPFNTANLSKVLWSEQNHKYFMANDGLATENEAERVYILVAVMLGANGYSSDVSANSSYSTTEPWYPEYNTARMLGPATTDLQTRASGGATFYERDFANGVALLNPTGTAVTTAFAPTPGQHYWGANCGAYAQTCTAVANATTVTIPRDGGMILLNHA